MSRVEPLLIIPVGVVIERRKSKSPWADFIWRPVAVLPGLPDAAPWTALDNDAEVATQYLVQALPVTYFLDAQGRVVGTALGPQTVAKLDRWVHRLEQGRSGQ